MAASRWRSSLAAAAVVVVAIAAVRSIPEPERTRAALFPSGEFGEFFSVAAEHGPFNKFKRVRGADETGGARMEFHEAHTGDCGGGDAAGCAASSCAPPMHIHTRQNETFRVLSGRFQYVVDGAITVVDDIGATAVVPAGAKHTFCRAPGMAPNETLVVSFALEPALDTEHYFATMIGLFQDSAMRPDPIHLVFLVCAYDMRLADIPRPLHEAMCLSLRLLGPLLGYKTRYDAYATPR